MDDGIIYWNLDPEIFSILGVFPIRYYSLLFITGLFVSLQVEKRIYRKENIPLENLDKLFIYVIVGIVLGARLGHCFFSFDDLSVTFAFTVIVLVYILVIPRAFLIENRLAASTLV